MRTIGGGASGDHRDIYKDGGIFLARGVANAGLAACPLASKAVAENECSQTEPTCEYGRFEKLDQLVDLDQDIDRHLKISARNTLVIQ